MQVKTAAGRAEASDELMQEEPTAALSHQLQPLVLVHLSSAETDSHEEVAMKW